MRQADSVHSGATLQLLTRWVDRAHKTIGAPCRAFFGGGSMCGYLYPRYFGQHLFRLSVYLYTR